MSNIVHSSIGGFVVQQQPNVNAAYGPWETLQEARLFLEQNFLELDENMQLAPNIPVGTTVAIYTDNTKQTIVEYWWSRNDLVQKTFGGSQYTLELIDKQGKKVSSISINDGYYNTPTHIIPRMLKISTNELVDFGYIQFSVDGGSYIKYNPNSIAHKDGIPTSDVTQSLVIEWRDIDNTLVTYSDVVVHNLPNIVQEFYAYNNSEEEAPLITPYNVTSPTYQGVDWSPNDYGQSDWGLIRKGVNVLNHVEWRVNRTRTNGLWSDLQGPFISGRWGFDGIVAVDKQTLYYYSSELITDDLDEYFDVSLDWLEHYVSENQDLESEYTDLLKRKWVSTYISPDPVNRYCYVTQRFKGMQGDQYVFGNWSTPALYSNFSVDGKDGDDIEYIYSRSKSEQIDPKALAELDTINTNYSSKRGLPGQEIPFNTNYAPVYWTDDPSGVTQEYPYEFCTRRYKSKDQSGICYEEFITPFVWASFGKEGPDGPGLEYIYYLTPDSTTKPEIHKNNKDDLGRSEQDDEYLPRIGDNLNDPCWSDDPLSVTSAMSTLWMSQRKGKKGKWGDFTDPIIWNQFKYTYELRLTNDNCSIPASMSGDYSIDSAKKATATKVELYLGLEKINLEEEEIEISCEHYTNVGENYYLNEVIPIDVVHLAVFTAKKKGQVLASKSQTVQLTKGKASYSLMCFPNSRIWYGGGDYSNTKFSLKVYSLDDTGLYRELTAAELSQYYIQYQVALTAELTTIQCRDLKDGYITISANSCDSDIHLMLYNKEGLLLDTEIIDAVDYSKIKGKDHSGISFDINDQINIPKNKANDGQYIRSATKTRIIAHKQLKEIDIKRIEVSAVDLNDTVTGNIEIGRISPNEFFVDEDRLDGDVMITYSVYIDIDGEEVLYELVQNVNISLDMIVYELKPKITQVMYNRYTGASVNQIPFIIISNDDEIPPYSIRYEIEGTDISGLCNAPQADRDAFFEFNPEINNYLKTCDSTQTLTFTLIVNGKEEDFESIDIWCEPKLDGYNYTIDLSNPNIEVPTGLDNNELQSWTSNDITVYQSGLEVSTTSGNYPYFEVNNLNNVKGIQIKKKDGSTNIYTTYFTQDIYKETSREQITYEILIHETSQNIISVKRSQSISFTDDTTYSLLSNPTSIVLNHGSGGTLTYSPTIQKAHNGDIEDITVGDLSSLGLHIVVDDDDAHPRTTIPFTYEVDKNRTKAILIQLKSSDNSRLYDFDDISIVRNGERGEDGVSVDYIYGRAAAQDTLIEESALTNHEIKTYNKDSLYKKGNFPLTIGGIKWSDDPQGINEQYQQEFISVSKYEKQNDGTYVWTNYSTPKIHAQFGKKGEDGNGVEYIYTAASDLKTTATSVGFTVDNSVTNPEGKPITGASQIYQDDDKVLDGWYDNIPDLSETHPNLYMTTRKKINGSWGPFKEPVLWNKYSTNLELILDNDQVIIDDNSDAATIKNLSETKVSAYYKGVEISDYSVVTASTSPELTNSKLKAVKDSPNSNQFYITFRDGASQIPTGQQTSGQITYTFEYEGERITRKQTVHIKDFSVGEGYKLMLDPAVVPTSTDDSGYFWYDCNVNITAIKIKGETQSEITVPDSSNGFALYSKIKDTETPISSSTYKVAKASGVAVLTPISIILKKNNVQVDSQTISFSTKGADGKSPVVINLTDDSDSIFIDSSTSGAKSVTTNVQVFFEGTDISSSSDATITTTIGGLPTGVTHNVIGNEIKITVSDSYYKNSTTQNQNQKISIPVSVKVIYNNVTTTQTINYHVNIFKNVLSRELYPSLNIIKCNSDGTLSDGYKTVVIKVKQFKDGKESLITVTDGSILYATDAGVFNNLTEDNVIEVTENGSKVQVAQLDLEGTTEKLVLRLLDEVDGIEIDKEIIPVIKDGTNGTNGVVGRNASLRICGVYDSTINYKCEEVINNTAYTDVVSYTSNGVLKFYQAIKNSKGVVPTNTTYWKALAFSDVTLTQQLLIYNTTEGDISGGFVDVEKAQKETENGDITDDGIILWAGGSGTTELDSAQSATFSVTRSGVIKASKGLFEGTYLSKDKDLSSFKVRSYIDPTYVQYVKVYSYDNGVEWYDDEGYTYEDLTGTSGKPEKDAGGHDRLYQIVAVMPPIVDFAEMSEIMVFPEKNYDEDKSLIRLEGITFPKYTAYYDSSGNEILENELIQDFIIYEYHNEKNSQFYKDRNPLYTSDNTKITSLTNDSFSSLRTDSKTNLADKLCNITSGYEYKNSDIKMLFPGIIYNRTDVPLYIRGKKPLVELPTGLMIDGAGGNTVLQDSSFEALKTTNSYVANNLYAPCVQGRIGIGIDSFDTKQLVDYNGFSGSTESYLETMFVDRDEEFGIDWSQIDVNPSLAYYFYKGNTKDKVLSIELYLDLNYRLKTTLEATKLYDFKYKTAKVYRQKTINIFGNVDVTGINFNLTKGNQQLDVHDQLNVCNISYALLRNSLINSPYTYMSFTCQQIPLLAYDPTSIGSEYYKLYGYIRRDSLSQVTDDGYIYEDDQQYWYSMFRSAKTSDNDAYDYLRFQSEISKRCVISDSSLNADHYIQLNSNQFTFNSETSIGTVYRYSSNGDEVAELDYESISYSTWTHNYLREQIYGYNNHSLCWFPYKIDTYASKAIDNNVYDIECQVIAYVKKDEFSFSKFKIFNVTSQTPYGYYLGCNFNGLETQVKNTLNVSPASVIDQTISS